MIWSDGGLMVNTKLALAVFDWESITLTDTVLLPAA